MKEFIEKLIARLEEYLQSEKNFKKIIDTDNEIKNPVVSRTIGRIEVYESVIGIINELAEEYKNTNIITDFLQYARNNADNYDTNEGWSLTDLIDLSIKYSEEYINASTDTSTNSSTWIPCSEKLPEEDTDESRPNHHYEVTLEVEVCGKIHYGTDYAIFYKNNWLSTTYGELRGKVIAWKEKTKPYIPKEKKGK